MNRDAAVLGQLAAAGLIGAWVMIVVAHPDDETIGLGAQLARFADARLVHLTDGAPRDGYDARRYGFADPSDYAAVRQAELAAALRAGGAGHLRRIGFGIPDKEAWRDLAGLSRRIADLLCAERPAIVFTHAYEGGHPDHDAAAFAVRAACRLASEHPAVLEMPFYHRRNGRLVLGRFVGPSSRREPERPYLALPLSANDRERKRRMIDCFATQRWLLEQFDIAAERFRVAPEYDFAEPPHPGELHYETLGWGIAGPGWRSAAVDALNRLGLRKARAADGP